MSHKYKKSEQQYTIGPISERVRTNDLAQLVRSCETAAANSSVFSHPVQQLAVNGNENNMSNIAITTKNKNVNHMSPLDQLINTNKKIPTAKHLMNQKLCQR